MRLLLVAVVAVAGCTLVVGDIDSRDRGTPDLSSNACADVQTDPHNCGFCGNDCTRLPGVDPAAVRCTARQCDLRSACAPGRADCSGGYLDGCETDISTADHCGSCTAACGGENPLCARSSGGLFLCAASCPFGTTQCGSSCDDVLNDPLHCGSCNHICAAGANQVAVCQNGSCSTQCGSGFHPCNGVCSSDSSINSCGVLCSPCPAAPANAVVICDPFGGCDFKCSSGFVRQNGSCVPGASMGDMATLLACDCRGLTDPFGSGNQCPVTSQCVGNNCCLEDQFNCNAGTCPPGACVDPTPCQASATPQ